MKPVVVDTNVAIVANDALLPVGDEGARPVECISACVAAIRDVTRNGHLLLDALGLIFDEYRRHLSFSGQPGVGDLFMKWVHDRQWDTSVCTRIEITPEESRGYVEFPQHPDLASFDRSDRKFVAVAAGYNGDASILQAVDEKKWTSAENALSMSGVSVRFLCRQKDD
jgi:hypothetical protein